MLGEPAVEVIAAQVVIAVDAQDLVFAHQAADHGDVEGAAPEVIDEEGAIADAMLPCVVHGRAGRFLEEADDLEVGQLSGAARGLDLLRVEVGGDRDHGMSDGVTVIVLLVLAFEEAVHLRGEAPQDARRDLLGEHRVRADVDGALGAHLALDRGDGGGLQRAPVPRLPAGDERLRGRIPADHGGDRLSLEAILEQGDLVAQRGHRRDRRVGRPEVNADSAYDLHLEPSMRCGKGFESVVMIGCGEARRRRDRELALRRITR